MIESAFRTNLLIRINWYNYFKDKFKNIRLSLTARLHQEQLTATKSWEKKFDRTYVHLGCGAYFLLAFGLRLQAFPVMHFFNVRMLNTRQWTSLRVLSTPYIYVGRENAALEINPETQSLIVKEQYEFGKHKIE